MVLAANALSAAAEHIVSHPQQSDLISDSEELEYIKRLADTMAAMASYHLSTIADDGEKFVSRAHARLTRFPSLETVEMIIGAWPVMLRAMGAELPKTFARGPPSTGAANPYNSQKSEPNGILPRRPRRCSKSRACGSTPALASLLVSTPRASLEINLRIGRTSARARSILENGGFKSERGGWTSPSCARRSVRATPPIRRRKTPVR